MSLNHALSISPRTSSAGFTLTEVVLSLGIVATALVAIIGLLPAGLDAAAHAANSTVVAAVLEDLNNRLQGQPLVTGPAAFSPAFFDDHGVFLDPTVTPSNSARRLYRADVQIGAWSTPPTGTSSLRPIIIKLSWPVDPASGAPLGSNNPQTVVTYTATALTGSNWTAIDAAIGHTYVPTIEY